MVRNNKNGYTVTRNDLYGHTGFIHFATYEEAKRWLNSDKVAKDKANGFFFSLAAR